MKLVQVWYNKEKHQVKCPNAIVNVGYPDKWELLCVVNLDSALVIKGELEKT